MNSATQLCLHFESPSETEERRHVFFLHMVFSLFAAFALLCELCVSLLFRK
jgi:hypothetical protein